MPHIHIANFEMPQLPTVLDEVTFHEVYSNDFHESDFIIECHYKGKDFFIWVKPHDEGYLIKGEKATRPAPNYYLQHAIKSFAKLSHAQILDSNIPEMLKTFHLDEEASVLKNINFFTYDFPRDKPLVIEVGFGSGRHLLYQAKNNPENLYIGIEIHQPSIEQVIKQISINAINNVMLLNYDARLFMEFVPSNCVKQIFVHFPVPWDKKPSRRVISRAFIEESVRVLDPKGTLELRTDSENYFAYSLQTFLDARQLDIQVMKNLDAPISSKYEDRWRKQEKNIYDIKMQGLEHSAPLELKGDFSFRSHQINADVLHNATIKSELGFIHFERFYKAASGALMVRLSLGSYERPEHLYLKITAKEISYFPMNPIASKTNLYMHQELQKVLYG